MTVRLLRRRRAAAGGDTGERETSSSTATTTDEQASELRRRLDEAREGEGESVGPARVESSAEADELEDGSDTDVEAAPAGENGATLADGASDPEVLADRRARVHGRARDAAESMRDTGGSGAA